MDNKFVRSEVFLDRKDICENHHGKEVWKSNTWRPYYRFEEYDRENRLTGIYYADENKKPWNRKLVVRYSDSSRRPYAIWFCSDGSIDMHFCCKYKKNGELDTVYFWACGGNLCNEFHYRKATTTTTVNEGKRVIYEESWPAITINHHHAYRLRELPDMTNIRGFFTEHMRDPLGPRTRCVNDWAIRDFLGITEEIMSDRFPKEPKPKFNRNGPEGMWIREMIAYQNTINCTLLKGE